MRNADIRYRPDIDGLRAVAILFVIGFHAFPARFAGGFVGVDVFFVISGFLISSIIFNRLELGYFNLIDFYARRIRRIFPALITVLLALSFTGSLFLLPIEYSNLLSHVLSGAFFVANFHLWTEAGYFNTAPDLKPLLHLWSLGVEEQFYIIWPIALMLAHRLGRRALAGIIILIGGASFIFNILLIDDYPVAVFFLPFGRFWELMLGAALAAARPALAIPWGTFPALRNVSSVVGLTLIAYPILFYDNGHPFPGWRAVMPTLGAVLTIAAGAEAWCNRRILSQRGMVFVGLISYPLYLWHWPLLSFGKTLEGLAPRNVQRLDRIGLISLSVLLAFATYRLFEAKIRSRPSPKYALRLALSLAGVCLISVAARVPLTQIATLNDNPFAWPDNRSKLLPAFLR